MSMDSRRGLGRGLSSIFTGADQAVDETAGARARLIRIGLDALIGSVELDLCGYLIDPGTDNADLLMRAPDIAVLDSKETYRLFATISRAEYLPVGEHPLIMAEGQGVAAITEHDGRRGIFLFGANNLTDEDSQRLSRFCAAFSAVLHRFSEEADETEHLELVVDQKNGTAHAEVTLNGDVGFGSAAQNDHAVASAAIAAVVNESAKLVSVSEVRGNDQTVMLVVVSGNEDRLGMGAAPVTAGADMAVALAAVRASRHIPT